MVEVKVYHDSEANTLTIWFGDPQQEYICEETGDEVVLMKDRDGHVIGIERINFAPNDATPVRVAFETISHPTR